MTCVPIACINRDYRSTRAEFSDVLGTELFQNTELNDQKKYFRNDNQQNLKIYFPGPDDTGLTKIL